MVLYPQVALLDVCHVYQPAALSRKDMDMSGPYAVYGANGQIGRHSSYNHEASELLLGCRGSVGEVHESEPKAWITNNAMVVRPDAKLIERGYLRHILAGVDLRAAISGTAQPQITRASLSSIRLALPSLNEQKRIVAILDEVFEGLSSVRITAERNLENAHDIFESYLQNVFTNLDPSWERKSLGDVCQFENGDRGKNYPHRTEYVEAGVPWINTGHIQRNGTLSERDMNYISKAKFNSLRSGKIKVGDLVYCLRGATLGKTALVDPYTEGAVASSLVIIRPGESVISRFLYFFLTSPFGQSLIKGYENGAAQPNLGAKSVAKFRIAVPTLAEQREITRKLDGLRAEAEHLAEIYARKLVALDALKQSLLHQAFSGNL